MTSAPDILRLETDGDVAAFLARYKPATCVGQPGRYCLAVRRSVANPRLVVRELLGKPAVVEHELEMTRAVAALDGITPRIEALAVRASTNKARGWIVCERLAPLVRFELSGATILRMLQNVQALHERGIFHGNLHTRNLMRRVETREILITDFGRAVCVDRAADPTLARRWAERDWLVLCSRLRKICPIPRAIVDACAASGAIDSATAKRWLEDERGRRFSAAAVYPGYEMNHA